MIRRPLADAIRPRTMDEIVGQEHLFGKKRRTAPHDRGRAPDQYDFYGPPGTGKTTAASVIAAASGMAFHKLNATTASLADVKGNPCRDGRDVRGVRHPAVPGRDTVLQPQAAAEPAGIHGGRSHNPDRLHHGKPPHFYVYNALISRSSLFEFKPVAPRACLPVLHRALDWLNTQNATSTTLPDDVGLLLAGGVEGDVRRAVGLLENAYFAAGLEPDAVITREHVAAFDAGIGNFSDDVHYDLLGCLRSPSADPIRTRQRSMWQNAGAG